MIAGSAIVIAAPLFIFVVALIFGAWPIAAAGFVEIGVIAFCLILYLRDQGDFERIQVSGDLVRVEWQKSGVRGTAEFNRCWARVEVISAEAGEDLRLSLGSHGKRIEVGAFLNVDDRVELSRNLRTRIGNAYG